MADYTNKDFEGVIIFSVSEPGAMGPNDIGFFTKEGKYFRLDYKSDETPWSEIREWFPVVQECYFNGPMRTDLAAKYTIVIGADENDRETHVAAGWKHWYLDFGNHLVIKEEYYHEVKSLLEKYDNADLTFSWEELLSQTDFTKHVNEMAQGKI